MNIKMNKTIKLIWQTAINLGFQFNETDAHEMYLELKHSNMNDINDKIIKALEDKVRIQEDIINLLNQRIEELEEDELLSCCGDELDPDIMICPTCKEHC
jgi:uncharacterized protein YpiB (UPF0302 family)